MRKVMRGLSAVVALLMLGSMLFGCSAVNNNPVVGKVGDVDLTYSAFYSVFQNIAQYYDYGAYEEQITNKDNPLPELHNIAFEQLVDATIPVAIAKQRGMTLTEEEETQLAADVEAQVQSDITESTSDMNAESTDEQRLKYFKKVIRGNGYSYDEYRGLIEQSMRDQKLADKLKAEVEAPAVVDEEVLNNWYDEQLATEKENFKDNLAAYYDNLQYYAYFTGVPPIYRPAGFDYIKQILITPPAEGETKDVDAIVTEVKGKLDAGEDFGALMDEYNDDDGMTSADDGYLYAPDIAGSYEEAFSTAAEALAEGEISGPVVTSHGTAFLYKTGAAPEQTRPLSEIETQARAYALQTAKDELYAAALEQWRSELKIVTYPERVSQVKLNSASGVTAGVGN